MMSPLGRRGLKPDKHERLVEMAFTLENFFQQALNGEGLLDTCWLRLHSLMLLVKQQR